MPASKLHRIGVLTCHPTHHHMPNIYGPLIQCVPVKGDYTPTRMTGMELTHIWDHDPERVQSFCEKFATVPVEHYDDMVDKVDGIMLTNLRAGDYFHLLAEPYLKAGIPVFFNRCFTPRLSLAREVAALSKKHGTPIIVASAWEYTEGSYALQEAVGQFGRDNIRGITAFNSSSEINHDVHGLWLVLAAAGCDIESVAVHRSIPSIYEHGSDVWTLKFKQRGDSPVSYATIHNTIGFGGNASMRINFNKEVYEQVLPWGGTGETRMQYCFIPPLLAFQRIIEGRGMEQSYEHIIAKTAIFLAGFKSHLELGGQEALLDELGDDFYVASDPHPLTYPDAMFA